MIAEGLDNSYDLIYSAGLFDYLNDRVVRTAGARLVDALAPGGTAVIGNFDVANPTRPLMEHVRAWPGCSGRASSERIEYRLIPV